MQEEEKRNAVLNHGKSHDGKFFYAVRNTGIFCRPSRASKTPPEKTQIF
ncbi:Ada metal-binding domain-containing protein [Yanshouia hominis]|uniref:Ada DNA repair metal-binding domain-containing protein n=1 Tax=Yanshouia hominis TaxID=2763673 RepID=A0ABR7NJ69_9FIRM|nr:Ada metal-binding domain-containing protein [Yanshouia hominis]MBC8576454.1 hypothetical protein [Yanshouia hominis]